MALARLPGYAVIWPVAQRADRPRTNTPAPVPAPVPAPSPAVAPGAWPQGELPAAWCSWSLAGGMTTLGPDALYVPVPLDADGVDVWRGVWRGILRLLTSRLARRAH